MKHSRYSIVILTAALFMAGCKAFKAVHMPEGIKFPETYLGSSDTVSVATMSPADFFADELLVSLINEAHKNNQDALIALERINIASAYLKMKRGDLIPTLDLATSASIQKYGDYTMEGVGNFDTNLSPNINSNQRVGQPHVPNIALGLNSSWEIDIWGKFRNRKKSAKSKFLASEQGRRFLSTAITAAVANLYYELQALDAELEIIRSSIQLQEAALEIVNARKDAGRDDQLAVERFMGQLYYTKGLEPAVRQNIITTENDLNALLGRLPQPIQRSGNLLTKSLPVNPQAGIPAQLLLRRPDMVQAELELASAGYEVKAARAEFLPALRINLSLGINSFNPAMLFSIPASLTYGILGGLTGPLLNRAQIQGNFNRMVAENHIAFYEYQKTVINGYKEVHTSLQHADLLTERFLLKEEEAQSLTRAVEISEELMRTGYASYLDVITAQKSVLDANMERVLLKKAMFQNMVTLYKASGGGWK